MLGGKPIRSTETRLNHTSLSDGPSGESPFSQHTSMMKASMGFGEEVTPCGISGRTIRLSDQRSSGFATSLAKVSQHHASKNKDPSANGHAKPPAERGIQYSSPCC